MPKIKFKNKKIEQDVAYGSDLLKTHELYPDLPLTFGCRKGKCGVCAVKIHEGMDNLTKLTKQEIETLASKKMSNEFRLACQCALNGDIEIEVCPKGVCENTCV